MEDEGDQKDVKTTRSIPPPKRPWEEEDSREDGNNSSKRAKDEPTTNGTDQHPPRDDEQHPPRDDEQRPASPSSDTATLPSARRGPNKSVNYKLKFQRARERYSKVQGTSHDLLKSLHEAQRKERRLEEEVDYLLDAIAARREDLVRAALEE